MANTETIYMGMVEDNIEFRVFKRLPVPIAREVQTLLIEMASDYEGNIDDFESGKVKAKDAKNIDFNILYQVYDLLLTKAVISPKITKEDIQNVDHEFQEYFQDLADLLLERHQGEKKKIKKKSTS